MENQNQTTNPFGDEKPKIVHLEKSESHYEYCRMQMHEIERVHRRTFVCNTGLCVLVSLLAAFHVFIGGFSLLSTPFFVLDSPGAVVAAGIFQILGAMVLIVFGYLAWANFHSLNIILTTWYVLVTVVGIVQKDYLTAIIGAVGVMFYYFSLRAMQHEAQLAEMDGYPDFREKFDITKSDIVIQTLLAHKGERLTKSTLFTTDYSLRRRKKKRPVTTEEPVSEGAAGTALAEELQKHLNDAKDARYVRTAIADLEAVTAAKARESAADTAEDAAEQQTDTADAETAAVPEEPVTPEEPAAPEETAAPDTVQAAQETPDQPEPEQPTAPAAPAQQKPNNPNRQNGKGKKKKKKR